jgi:Pregnancy-associated plasma protein-A
MKPATVMRATAMTAFGIGMLLFGASSLLARSPGAGATSGASVLLHAGDENFGEARASEPASSMEMAMGASSNRRVDDTVSPGRFASGLDRAVDQFRRTPGKQGGTGFEQTLHIDVVFHVLSGPTLEGNLSELRLIDQVAVLNAAFQPVGLHFSIAEIRRYPDSPYFAGGCFPTTQEGIRMKSELAVNPARTVNIYTCKLLPPFIVGYGTLPNEFRETDPQHGVIVDYGVVTGGTAPWELGHTLVHELGHYFGLLHTFQGGCAEPGDSVADTPAEASAAFGCQIGRDTCPQSGVDPIDNFMDYSDDACTNRFTPLQNARMQALISTYRPSLAGSAFSIGPGITGNWYNPGESGHGFSIEVLPGNLLVAQWYVFAPGGGPAWIVATGPINGKTAMLQGVHVVGPGGRFPPNFDPAQIQREPWGTLTFTFDDCNRGQVSWQPVVAGFASGSMSIVRLTMPAGLACP